MRYRPAFNSRGAAFISVLSAIVVIGGVAASVLLVSASRYALVNSLDVRLESERIANAYSGLMKQSFTRAVREGLSAVPTETFNPATSNLEVVSVDTPEPFPLDVLWVPRAVPPPEQQDPGKPGSMIWSLRHTEAIRARGTVEVETEYPNSPDVYTRTVNTEPTVWRVPTGTLRFTSSKYPLSIRGFTINADGPAVVIGSPSPAGIQASTLRQDPDGISTTAGVEPALAFSRLYANPSFPGLLQITLDSLADMPAGFAIVDVNGTKYPGIDLGEFRGPNAVHINGTLAANGVFVLGSNTSERSISIAISGPAFLANSNVRYALVAADSDIMGFYSNVVFDATSGEYVAATGPARSQTWTGHCFITQINPRLYLPENWTNQSLYIRGSLHVTGGEISLFGAGANTLPSLGIAEPDWASFDNPFTFEYRHESVLFTAP